MEVLLIFALIVLNGIFSMSEMALVSSRKSKLESEAKRGNSKAKLALEIANSPNRFFSTVQIGITLIGILTGTFSGEKMTQDFELYLSKIEILQHYAHTISVTVVVMSITFLSLVLGELVPKRIGLTNPEGISKALAGPMQLLSTITAPFVWLLTFTTDFLIKLLGIKSSSENKITEEEIKAIIQEGTEDGTIQEIEQEIVARVFSLGDRNIASLMTHRSDVVILNLSASADLVRETVNQEMHAVYPVCKDNTDNIVGVVLLKELFKHISDADFELSSYLLVPQYIHENSTAYKALKQFKSTGIHHGIVTDEYGQMQGLVTLNDLLEALVGDESEFDDNEFTCIERADGSWLIDGQFPLADFLRKFDKTELAKEYPYNTISGLILHIHHQVPHVGQKLRWLNFEIEIVDMDGARIDKIILLKTH